MSKKGGNTVETVFEIAQPIAQELGLILWDVRFEKEGSSWYLRIIIDKPEGVSFDDCEAISRPLDKKLDELDPIEQAYYLEVSSPGIGRELKKDWHFTQSLGKMVEIRLIRPCDGVRDFCGILNLIEKNIITVSVEEKEIKFDLSDCAFVKLHEDL
ncbi:MAG: ribosome maturation factor RimP [Oscillospiraceae bacterium]